MAEIIVPTNIASEDLYTWVRPLNINYKITNCKPNTRHWVYFDLTPVDQYIIPDGGKLGDPVITDSSGMASGVFSIPANTFYTGTRKLVFVDTNNFPKISDQTSSAENIFTSRVTKQTVNETINTVTLTRTTPSSTNVGSYNPGSGSYLPPSTSGSNSSTTPSNPSTFDETSYLAANPDVRIAVESGALKSGYEHYINYGKNEGRNPNGSNPVTFVNSPGPSSSTSVSTNSSTTNKTNVTFTEYSYLVANPDVAQAIKDGHFTSAYQHYQMYGKDEGRSPIPTVVPLSKPKSCSRGVDPLAQSFFTIDTLGGITITKIDLFFSKKSVTVPVTIEICELINGYPDYNAIARVVVDAKDVKVSNDASVATTFVFPCPVVLGENQNYCFIVIAPNTDEYWLYTSKLGEVSFEDAKIIAKQPYIGSLFKSENNITWTAEQDSDIKFVMYRAEFDKTANITLGASSIPILIKGENVSVVEGSKDVTIKFDHYHGLISGDFIDIDATNYFMPDDDSVNTGRNNISYRGIPGSDFNGSFPVTFIDEYMVKITVASAATSTGVLSSPGIVTNIVIINGGIGYNLNSSIILSGGSGTGAQAQITEVKDGVITEIKMLSYGSGYLSAPNISTTGGNGASLIPVSESLFKITTNRESNEYLPRILAYTPPYTELENSLTYVTRSEFGSLQRTSSENINLNVPYNPNQRSVIVSSTNKTRYFSGVIGDPTQLNMRLKTANTQVSPILNLKEIHELESRCYVINNQEGEVIDDDDPNSPTYNTEFNPSGGSAKSRYVSKQFTLDTASTGVRFYLSAYSEKECDIDVYIRTSLSTDDSNHIDLKWKLLKCDVSQRNLSKTIGDILDYTFYYDNLPEFDTYDIKIVMRSLLKNKAPLIKNYRTIILA
jgi:hypothetical protein